MVVVGSDQVWNISWAHSRFYLLEEAPPQLRRIAYAASIGLPELPPEVITVFQKSLAKFEAISCRENEACEICRGLGFEATHVLDPTLLLERNDWLKLGHISSEECSFPPKKKLVCYFLSEDAEKNLSLLATFARKLNCQVSILVFDKQRIQDLLPIPTSPRKIKLWGKGIVKHLFSEVQIIESAGPLEFVKEHATATWVITDSFHSLMFSLIFGKNCRVIRPDFTPRKKMFKRVEEIAKHAEGKLVIESVQEALLSFINGENAYVHFDWIENMRKQSLQFLTQSLKKQVSIRN